MTKEEILENMKKEGVKDLDGLAELIVKKSNPSGDANKPVTNSVIIYNHGFVTS